MSGSNCPFCGEWPGNCECERCGCCHQVTVDCVCSDLDVHDEDETIDEVLYEVIS